MGVPSRKKKKKVRRRQKRSYDEDTGKKKVR
jgi:hypothetical protein